MQLLRKLAGKIWLAWFYTNATLFFLVLYPLVLIFISREKWFPIVFKLIQLWARWILFGSGIRYEIKKNTKLKKDKPYVFCPNHASILDTVITYVAIPNYFHFMGKAELRKAPLFGIFFKRMNIAVDRGSIRASHRAFMRAHDDIQKGISISVFPEATVPACAPKLGPVKNGAFKLAIENQIPLVPITYLNTWKILPERNIIPGPHKVHIYIHEPIITKGMTDGDLKKLKEETMKAIGSVLEERVE
ncbi:MAG: lysophospholipid acyltransferase family protein [Bacteroidia bacterium]